LEDFTKEYQIFRGQLAAGIDPQDTGGDVQEEDQAGCEPKRLPASNVPEWLRSTWPDGYTEGSLSHRLSEYLEAARTGTGIPKLAPRTLRARVSTAKSHVIKRLGAQPATSITQDVVSDLFADLTKKSPQMVREVKKVLSGCFEYCRAHVKEMRRLANPTIGIRITVPKGKRDRYLSENELEILFRGLDQLSDSKAKDVYNLILASGCRPGEAAGVHAEDVITMGGERVWKVRYKSNRDHLIPLIGPIAEIINRRYLECGGKGPLFWPGVDRTKDYPEQLKRANKDIRQITGISFKPHDLRRTMRTHIEPLGVRPEVGEALLNHQKGEMEGTYALYTYWKERKEALTLWHSKLASIREARQEQAA
jgi:integrase